MSKTLWWILAGSIPLALIIMFTSWWIMRKKIQNVKTQYITGKPEDLSNPALNRNDHGHLLWDLKEKTQNPLEDLSMEFIINTLLRNQYQTFMIQGFEEKYEEESIIKKTKAKKDSENFNVGIINFDKELINQIDQILKKLKPQGMIIIVNATKDKNTKEFISYLKLTGIRNEFHKINKGIILIAN